MQKIKRIVSSKKNNLNSNQKPKNLVNYVGKRKNINNGNIKLTSKNEKFNHLTTLNQSTDDGNNKYSITELQESNIVNQYKIKGALVKHRNKTKYNNSTKKNRMTYFDRSVFFPFKYNKTKYRLYNYDQYDKNKKSEYKINDSEIIKHKINNISNLDLNGQNNFFNKSYIGRHSNKLFYKKIFNNYKISKPRLKNLNKQKYQKKEQQSKNKNNKDNSIDNNNNNNINENNDENKIVPERPSLNSLIDQYFDDMKMITDKDFDIFEFKEKVGYKNVLPLMCHCILKTLGLFDHRIINLSKLEAFLFSVSDGYKESTLYHNSLHGADVTQSLCVYFINSNAEQISETNVLDLLGMIISAMGHDLGHPGLTNNFHINASTELALTYNDSSCLENFHCSFLFNIIKKDETNIFEKLSVENYKNIRKRMIRQILATDMANHGEVMSLIRTKIKLSKEQKDEQFILLTGNEKTKFDEQQVLLNYLIHMADLGHNCKKYEISKKWVRVLCEEFWIQGDKEKSLGIPVSFLCDRDKIDVPASQVNFLKGFIISSFDSLVDIFPKLKYTLDNAKNNIKEWQKLWEQKRVTGWTPKKEKKEEDNKKI